MSLNGAEQELLRQLAAFAGPFDLDAVEAAASDLTPGGLLRVFRGLVDRSLVTSENDGHHRLLETVKLFAQQHWADPDALGDYMERHTQWALRHVRSYSVEARHTSFELGSWVARNYDELRAVENRLSEHERTTELVELLSAHNFSIGYGPSARAVALIERIDRYLESDSGTAHETPGTGVRVH